MLIVFTNYPEGEQALALARHLVERRLAACVNVLDGCTSVYRWHGTVETAQEVPVMIKTRRDLYAQVEQAIRQHHPYELPEVVAVPVDAGLPDYLHWVAAETDQRPATEQTRATEPPLTTKPSPATEQTQAIGQSEVTEQQLPTKELPTAGR